MPSNGHEWTSFNPNSDFISSKNKFFMCRFLQILIVNWKKKEMIVFDMFIDIESTDEFSDLFFQIFMISSENRSPVKIEVTVRCTESDSRLHKSISRPTVGVWTNPVGVRSIGKRFFKKKLFLWSSLGL